MFVIGEKLNCSVKRTRQAVESRDEGYIARAAKRQEDAGAGALDINAGMFTSREPEMLIYLMKEARKASSLPFMLDSPSCSAMRAALEEYDGPPPILNSLSLESNRFGGMLTLVKEFKSRVVALCMDDRGVPDSPDMVFENARNLYEKLTAEGVAPNDIFLDPLVRPLSTGAEAVSCFLGAAVRIREELEGVHIVCGLSNVSYGLPDRKLINRTFLAMAMHSGVDSAILDPLDEAMMDAVSAADALMGYDEYCMNYIERYRGKIERNGV